MQEAFYGTLAQVCFALLGLWWVVVQFKHNEFVSDPVNRRTAFMVSMYFALPGIMSLLSLLATDATFIWRIAFALAGACGAALSVRSALGAPTGWGRGASWVGTVLFAVVTIVALFPGLVQRVGLSATPLQVEGVTVTLVLVVGIVTAWRFFATRSRTAQA